MPDAVVHVAGRETPLQIRINGPDPTFHLDADRIAARALAPVEPVLLDLLEIACAVFSADGTVRRGGDVRRAMGAEWRRRFDIDMPVRRPDAWRDPETQDLLSETLTFLTEDDYGFNFENAAADGGPPDFLDLDPSGATFEAENVVLFSGGLDSFAGALESLNTRQDRVILLSHRAAPKIMPRQEKLGGFLGRRFPGRVLHLNVRAHRAGRQAVETTQRSRSFLFTALGAATAATFGARRIAFFENGVVGHNLPISPQVVGSMATRTTHPLALHLLSRLLDRILPGRLAITNDYQWMTKTDVVQRIEMHQGLEMLSQGVSCTTVRDQTTLHTHCGACSQCIDRRMAVLAAGVETHDPEDAYATPVLTGSREQPRSRTLAVEWTSHARKMRKMSEAEFFTAFGMELSRIWRGYPDRDPAEIQSAIYRLHQRHAESVHRVLRTAIGAASDQLASRDLPDTSLLRLWSGSSGVASEVTVPTTPAPDLAIETGGIDLDPTPDGPLLVSFFKEGETSVVVVVVVGLCDVRGAPAGIAHHLKPFFDEDRAAGLRPEKHRYIGELPKGMSKENARTTVYRLRKCLADAYRDLFGDQPDAHLLVQGRQAQGYRLDPSLQLRHPDEL